MGSIDQFELCTSGRRYDRRSGQGHFLMGPPHVSDGRLYGQLTLMPTPKEGSPSYRLLSRFSPVASFTGVRSSAATFAQTRQRGGVSVGHQSSEYALFQKVTADIRSTITFITSTEAPSFLLRQSQPSNLGSSPSNLRENCPVRQRGRC